MEITLDTLDGAEVDIGFQGSRVVRTGIITGIPASARSDPNVLARAIFESGLPAFRETHPYFSTMRVVRIVAKAAGNTNDAAIQLHYEGPQINAMPASWSAIYVIDDSVSTVSELESIDRFGKVYQATYNYTINTTDSGYATQRQIPSVKSTPIPVMRPRRRLTVSGLLFGRTAPSSWSREALGYVNDAPWPTGSLWTEDIPDPIGYWLCTEVSANTERFYRDSGIFEPKLAPYRIRVSFESRVYRNWSSGIFYKNAAGVIPPDIANHADTIKGLVESSYVVGQQTDVSGYTHVGPYRTSPFPQVFGF